MTRPNVPTPALEMVIKYGDFSGTRINEDVTADKFRLTTGLPFSLHLISGRNEDEGLAVAFVADTFDELAMQPEGPLVRMHSACSFSEIGDSPGVREWLDGHHETGDILFMDTDPSDECDCRAQRVASQERIVHEGGVYFDLVSQEGRGAGLEVKREAYRLHLEEGLDTVDAYERLGVPFDTRQYGHCARFLIENGIDRVRLLSNNPRKVEALFASGIEVTPVPLVVGITDRNKGYLETKRDKAGHKIPANLVE